MGSLITFYPSRIPLVLAIKYVWYETSLMKNVNIKAWMWWLIDKNVKYCFPLNAEALSYFKVENDVTENVVFNFK